VPEVVVCEPEIFRKECENAGERPLDLSVFKTVLVVYSYSIGDSSLRHIVSPGASCCIYSALHVRILYVHRFRCDKSFEVARSVKENTSFHEGGWGGILVRLVSDGVKYSHAVRFSRISCVATPAFGLHPDHDVHDNFWCIPSLSSFRCHKRDCHLCSCSFQWPSFFSILHRAKGGRDVS